MSNAVTRRKWEFCEMPSDDFPTWLDPQGKPVSCTEKIKVLNENLAELRQIAQDAFEDAILIGCDETQVRQVLAGLIAALDNPYQDQNTGC